MNLPKHLTDLLRLIYTTFSELCQNAVEPLELMIESIRTLFIVNFLDYPAWLYVWLILGDILTVFRAS